MSGHLGKHATRAYVRLSVPVLALMCLESLLCLEGRAPMVCVLGKYASMAARERVPPLPRGKYRLRWNVSELDAFVLQLLALRTSNRVPAVSSTSSVALGNASCTHAPHVRITVERTGPALFERPAWTFLWK